MATPIPWATPTSQYDWPHHDNNVRGKGSVLSNMHFNRFHLPLLISPESLRTRYSTQPRVCSVNSATYVTTVKPLLMATSGEQPPCLLWPLTLREGHLLQRPSPMVANYNVDNSDFTYKELFLSLAPLCPEADAPSSCCAWSSVTTTTGIVATATRESSPLFSLTDSVFL